MTSQHSWLPHNDALIAYWQLRRLKKPKYIFTCRMWAAIPVLRNGKRHFQLLWRDLKRRDPTSWWIMLFHSNCWVFLSFYLRRPWLVLVGSLNLVSGPCLAKKKGDANRNSPEALKRTFFPFKGPLVFSVCPELILYLSGTWSAVEHPPVPQLAWPSRAAENRRCFITVSAFHTGAPCAFSNHNSFQLWPWALICPRSMYCFNVNVETCAKALKKRERERETLQTQPPNKP